MEIQLHNYEPLGSIELEFLRDLTAISYLRSVSIIGLANRSFVTALETCCTEEAENSVALFHTGFLT